MKRTIALILFHTFFHSAAHFAPWGGRSAFPSVDDVDSVVESEDIGGVDGIIETKDVNGVDSVVEPEGVDGVDGIVEPEDADGVGSIVLFWSWDERL